MCGAVVQGCCSGRTACGIAPAGRSASRGVEEFPASIASSIVRRPGVLALTSTAMLPGLCWFFHIFVWARGMSAQAKTSDMQGSRRRSMTSWLAWLACSRLAKWLPWMRFCRIHTKRASKVRLKPVVPAQNTTMPPRFTTKQETGKVCSPGCSKRSEEHTSELQSLMRISYAVFCLKKKKKTNTQHHTTNKHNTTTSHHNQTNDTQT